MAKKKTEKKDKKEKVEEVKASSTEEKQESSEEWLEEELKETTDDLMTQAAERIKTLEGDVKEWEDKYLRLHAEWDTYRRRTNEQREQDKATATEGLVSNILPVLDDFERSIKYAEDNGEEGLLDGVKAVYSKLVNTLTSNGVEVLNPEKDEEFNALEHQAVSTVENKEVFDESIASVLQKGYKMGKKVIRPATVVVTTGGETRPKEEE